MKADAHTTTRYSSTRGEERTNESTEELFWNHRRSTSNCRFSNGVRRRRRWAGGSNPGNGFAYPSPYDVTGNLPTATGGKEIGLDVLLATPQYFAGSRRQAPESALAKPSLLFYVTENTHIDDLPEASPEPYLRVGSTSLEPVERVTMADSYHHRTSVIRFSAADLTETAKLEGSELVLVFPASQGTGVSDTLLTWAYP